MKKVFFLSLMSISISMTVSAMERKRKAVENLEATQSFKKNIPANIQVQEAYLLSFKVQQMKSLISSIYIQAPKEIHQVAQYENALNAIKNGQSSISSEEFEALSKNINSDYEALNQFSFINNKLIINNKSF